MRVVDSVEIGPGSHAPNLGRRRFDAGLAALTIALAIPWLVVGSQQYVDYDGYWHLFIAGQEGWRQFFQEVQSTAHPPLYFLVMKYALMAGDHPLIYRAASLASAAASTFFIGRAVLRTTGGGGPAILAAFAFGSSVSILEMSLEIRSYLLAIFFILVAFVALARFINSPEGASRNVVIFCLASSCAILSHYFSYLFLVGAALTWATLLVRDRELRARFSKAALSASGVISMGVLALVSCAAYYLHARHWARRLDHLPHYHFPGGPDGLWSFFRTGAADEVALFTPLPAGNAALLTGLLFVGVPMVFSIRWLAGGETSRRSSVSALPHLMFLSLLFAVVTAAALGRYPFGGALRQQFILFPFLVISLFTAVGSITSRIRRGSVRFAVLSILAISLATLAFSDWKKVRITPGPPWPGEMAKFRTHFADENTVLVDQFSLIPFFSSHVTWRWHLVRILRESPDGNLELYRLTRGNRTLMVCRERYFWTMDLTHPALLSGVRQCLENVSPPSLAVFSLSPERTLTEDFDQKLRSRAKEQGVVLTRVALDLPNIYAGFAMEPANR